MKRMILGLFVLASLMGCEDDSTPVGITQIEETTPQTETVDTSTLDAAITIINKITKENINPLYLNTYYNDEYDWVQQDIALEGLYEIAVSVVENKYLLLSDWDELMSSMANLNAIQKETLVASGYKDVSMVTMLLNDQNQNKVLVSIMDGKVYSDVVNDY